MVFEPMCGGRLEGPGTFDDTLARHVSSEAACTMRAPFALGDADDLRELIRAADFGEIAIRRSRGPCVFRPRRASCRTRWRDHRSPAFSDEARAALVRDIGEALRRISPEARWRFLSRLIWRAPKKVFDDRRRLCADIRRAVRASRRGVRRHVDAVSEAGIDEDQRGAGSAGGDQRRLRGQCRHADRHASARARDRVSAGGPLATGHRRGGRRRGRCVHAAGLRARATPLLLADRRWHVDRARARHRLRGAAGAREVGASARAGAHRRRGPSVADSGRISGHGWRRRDPTAPARDSRRAARAARGVPEGGGAFAGAAAARASRDRSRSVTSRGG